jgi:hypothetical protein
LARSNSTSRPAIQARQRLASGEALFGSNAGFEKIAAVAGKLTARLEVTLANVDALLINVNDITKDAKFKEDVKATIANARSTLAKAEETLPSERRCSGESGEASRACLSRSTILRKEPRPPLPTLKARSATRAAIDRARLDDVQKLAADLRPK